MKQLSRHGFWMVLLVVGSVLTAGATQAHAQQRQPRATDHGPFVQVPLRPGPDTSESTPEWGTAALSVDVVPAFEMQAYLGGGLSNYGYLRYSPAGDEIEAPLRLPSGALIKRIELQGCDQTDTDQIVFTLFRVGSEGVPTILSPTGATGTVGPNGCGSWSVDLTTFHTVENAYTYYIGLLGGITSNTRITAVRVYYSLQVSPAPATASFPNDVPTSHPYFRFIEALKASGITGGCSPGSFCPDAPVTRGQMAVFLSAALGLHWPN